jgi:hypothetical protein
MFEAISVRLVALIIYAVFITIAWIVQGAKAMWRENKQIMRLHERDKKINDLISWQASALELLDKTREGLEEAGGLFDKLENANNLIRDLERLNAELVAKVMIFKSRFPYRFDIAMSEIEKGQSLIENGELRIENGDYPTENESGVLRKLDIGTTASAGTKGGRSATA